MIMTAIPGARLAEMRLDKVVATSAQQGPASFFAVLNGVSQDRQLAILIGETEAITLSASLARRLFARPMSPQFAAGLVHALGGRVGQVRIDRLVPVRGGTAYGATVQVEGPSGAGTADARPSDALNLAALVQAPIFVAPEVLADAAVRMEGDSPEAVNLRRALTCEPMIIQWPEQ
jgi:bifunctional DNase/RNase